jgi:hypothetical protein
LEIVFFENPTPTQVQLWDCEPRDAQHGYGWNQMWFEQYNGDGTWSFKVTGAGRFCLDSEGSQSPGSPVVVWSCNGGNNQKWTLDPSGQQLQSVGSPGYCADIDPLTFQGDGNGAQVALEPCE